MNLKLIRNFAIISHIDHGKSTLSDRLMEETKTVSDREMTPQLLDSMGVEQAHGVTVKSRTVQNTYRAKDGQDYQLNLIDTPGHVDFNYEVTKSLSATDGVILLVDATQGVQAQTVANWRLAHELGLPILPVLNKIDAASAQIDESEEQIRQLDPSLVNRKIYHISAKTGLGVADLLEAIVHELPAPVGEESSPLKALVFDSEYDAFQGVIAQVRVIDGTLKKGAALQLMANGQKLLAKEVGIYRPNRVPVDELTAGEVGYVVTGIKDPKQVTVGDTLTSQSQPAKTALPGYQQSQPVVYAGIYPVDDYNALQEALQKLALNDTSLVLTDDQSEAMGPGFRAGFLGIFHLQIIKERLETEFGIEVVVTAPNVSYRVQVAQKGQDIQTVEVNNPTKFPDFDQILAVEEPVVKATIMTPNDSVNQLMKLADDYRGIFMDMGNQGDYVRLVYQMPLSEIAYDFFNQLKSLSHGYASFSTETIGYQEADLVKVDVQINYAKVDALAFVTHRSRVAGQTQQLVHELKMTIPRRLYPMPVQALVEGRVVARVDVPPLRKNAAVNGQARSVSKKQALLRRQSANKRQAAQSDIELPQAVFNALLSLK
ncbi:translation elongation factor 4 [Fructobacillus evanidus]|uniref:Elongation factor 4 n=1 Tax=Fructobacillus evanidus TaxID=3064281 RepID=A0ABM9MW19_9LACO|nr:Translation elongation factor EF-4 [Fructobacillus sp. LMG 32999]CAK1229805.1 Translation elongation factor EF-4 [Fructobacillus sp. LMG 32999]CAK1232585.1 Translation elongation factor EF-4 [Fructobacillus sp. LMG 32999]CAK1232752.1 Translation elongation factor EF-4 [Fructobacillus sp. LMG 32999]CAK1233875.1 Translation elongation factor EF-4 [Fructobacillus sp. LMG 32999]